MPQTNTEIAEFRFYPNKVNIILSMTNDLDNGSVSFEVCRTEDWANDNPIECTTYKEAKAQFMELIRKELFTEAQGKE